MFTCYFMWFLFWLVKNLNSWGKSPPPPLDQGVLAPAAQPLADHAISSYLFSGGLGIGGPNTSHPTPRRFTR
jgi:hypothetical protein